MKTNKFYNLLLVVPLLTLLLMSCGKDENTVNGDVTNTDSDAYTNANHREAYDRALALRCNSGETRLPVIHYNTNEVTNLYKIAGSGSLTKGRLSGEAVDLYLGISVNQDVIAVSKIADGSKTKGFNVSISLCTLRNHQGYDEPIFSTSRSIERVAADFPYFPGHGINLFTNPECAFNVVATTAIQFSIGPYEPGNLPSLYYPWPVLFEPLVCE